jgi:hypothetical protein
MSTEKKNPLKRDQALNDATGGQFGGPSSLPQYDTLEMKMDLAKKPHEKYQEISNSCHQLFGL